MSDPVPDTVPNTAPVSATESKKQAKNTKNMSATWREARALMWTHRKKLGFGFVLMVISRLSGFVLPAGSKYLIDTILGEPKRMEMLGPLALA
ncbi:hypothetical protein HQ496_05210, partial [bacterium]|nr:hypothetical protein [bacterium]